MPLEPGEGERASLGKPAAADVKAFDCNLQARKFFYEYTRKSSAPTRARRGAWRSA